MKRKYEVEMSNLSKKERKMLQHLIKKANQEPFEQDEEYFYIITEPTSEKTIGRKKWENNGRDRYAYEHGNAFRDYDEAQFELDRQFYATKWKRLSILAEESVNPLDFLKESDVHCHYYIVFDGKNLKILYTFFEKEGTCFPSYESIEEAIKEIGEENIKKYILGIKEE